MTEPMESQEDILISRIIDGNARADDLQQIATLAADDASVWDRLAAADADRAAIMQAMDQALAVADAVEAPMHELTETGEPREHHRFVGWTGWMGWAAAAALALAWTMFGRAPAPTGLTSGPAKIQNVALNADDALAKYIEASKAENRFIRELPKVMVESHASPDGHGTEVTYVRQFVEKAHVSDLYELSADEHGRPGAVRVSSPIGTSSDLY